LANGQAKQGTRLLAAENTFSWCGEDAYMCVLTALHQTYHEMWDAALFPDLMAA
jgi:hypothetical protein